MRPSVLARTLADGRRALIGWSIGLAVMVLFNMAFYPSIKGNSQFDDLMDQMPEALRSFVGTESLTSPAGYLDAQFFIFVVPLLFLIFTISRGSDAIAGEEQRKTIDVLLSNPVTRRRVLIEKFESMLLSTTLVGAAFVISLWLSTVVFKMDIGVWPIVRATAGAILLAVFFGAVALLVGAATGKKGLAIAVAAATATLFYFLNSLALSVESLSSLQKLSPFYYGVGSSPTAQPLQIGDAAVLLVGTAVLLAGAILTFERRDLAS